MSAVELVSSRSLRRRWGGLLAAAALLVVPLRVAAAEAEEIDPVVDEYDKRFDVGAGEAARRLDLQARGGGLQDELKRRLGADFAGFWFDNDEGEFVVPVLSKEDAAVASGLFEGRGFEGREYRTALVESSVADLEAARDRLTAAFAGSLEKGKARSGLDIAANRVVLEISADAPAEERASLKANAGADPVAVDVVEADPSSFDDEAAACKWTAESASCDPPLHGGVSIWSEPDLTECTAGFAATGNALGNSFVMTAGHCLKDGLHWWAETSNGFEAELGGQEGFYYAQGQADAGLIRVKNSNWWVQNWGWRGHIVLWGPPSNPAAVIEPSRPIYGSRASFAGEYVCHTGITTGMSCGTVKQLKVKVAYEPGNTLTQMTKVEGICGDHGDSGGSVWGETYYAVGIWSGGQNGTCTTHYYSEVRELEQVYGVHVTPW